MEGTIGEIRFFAGDFAPMSWALCQGQLLPIRNYTAVFSIVGTYYGGDGRTTFGLPDFRGRMAVGVGQSPNLSEYQIGELIGAEGYTILANNMPSHTHTVNGSVTISGTPSDGDIDTPQNNYPASLTGTEMYSTTNNGSFMANMQHNLSMSPVGSSLPVSNVQPLLGMNFIICLQGTFPYRP